MQIRLALPSDLPAVRARLSAVFGPTRTDAPELRLDPMSQLIRAVIGSRAFDEVGWAAFVRLHQAFPGWGGLVHADPDEIEPLIDPVAFADRKARQLPILARLILLKRGELALDFLAGEPLDEAVEWLTRLNGITLAIAAATLNFSRLNRRILVVDAHVHRVARRMGLISRDADADQACLTLMEQAPADWTSDDLLDLHGLLKRTGQAICAHFEPACGLCSLHGICPRIGVAGDQESRILAFPPARKPDDA